MLGDAGQLPVGPSPTPDSDPPASRPVSAPAPQSVERRRACEALTHLIVFLLDEDCSDRTANAARRPEARTGENQPLTSRSEA